MSTANTTSILSLFPLNDDQRAAVTSRQAAISVTAGAGSGKTRTLVGRYLALLESGLPPHSLVAITFTDKAAREMRNRIRVLTADWLAHADAASQWELWTEAFSALDAARISTIHALCATILRTHPAEAALDPDFTVLDEGQSALWRARAVEEGLAWAVTEPDAMDLFRHFKEGQLRYLLADLLEKRLDAAQALAAVPDDPLPLWSAALDRWYTEHVGVSTWQESLDTLTRLQAQTKNDRLELARRKVLACWTEARRAQTDQNWDALFVALSALRSAISTTGGQQKNWAGDDLAVTREAMAALRVHFDKVVGRLIDKRKPINWSLDQQAAGLLPPIRRLLAQTQAIYQAYKTEAHTLDFDDLEQMTAQLLAESETVRARWQQDINAVMLVDEFQDTNQRQREIVYALAGFEPLSTSALTTKTKHGSTPQSSLFVVGDAKQSIYRFRGADVTVFRQVQADIRQAGGVLINFDLTFRAHQALVDLTNALLSPLMLAEDDPTRPYDVPFAPLKANRLQPEAGIQPPYLEFHLGLGEDKVMGRTTAAVSLANRLLDMQQTGQIKWQDVALLFRASTAFGVYEDALEQAGIPFVTVAGRGFYDRPEVRDLLNALTAIADPTDDLAVAGLLRSPAIGLSDGALHLLRWTERQQRRPLWSALQSLADIQELPAEDRQQAEFARQLIAGLNTLAGRVPVVQLLKRFLDETHYRTILRLAPGGERMRRNIDKLLADAHRSELITVAEFLEYVAALGDVGARESEAPTEAGGAVQLMTIHKAKGLEFPVVVLADAGYSGGFRPTPFYLDSELGLLLNLTTDDAQPAAFRLAAGRAAEQEAAEERRLLYVAATRAMEKFIVSGDAKLSTAKATPGKLLLAGWLADLARVVGLSEVVLPEMPVAPQSIPLAWENEAAACTISPPASVSTLDRPDNARSAVTLAEPPDLLEPLAAAPAASLDEKLIDRESDPPPRVWRVVPPTEYEVPAWVVGSLTHTALRYWRFPNGGHFISFLRPFALEAGLTDPASIDIVLNRVTTLLARFQAHTLFTQLSTAERHHEVPFSLTLYGQVRSGIIDLLFRATPDAPWTIAEFKTDRLPEDANLSQHAQEKGYRQQVETYQQAVMQQMGLTPRVLLVFLNAGRSVRVLNLL